MIDYEKAFNMLSEEIQKKPYCNNCYAKNLKDGDDGWNCDDCHRKNIMWRFDNCIIENIKKESEV